MNHERRAILRMIDANLNRAREGIRVVEDCARFMLDDAAIASSCKQLRDRLRAAVDGLDLRAGELLEARDTHHDVGKALTAPGESDRSGGMPDLVSAACKRAGEALRVIEESSKALGACGASFEAIRYQLYTIEQRTIERLTPRCPQWTLCVLVTGSLCVHHDPIEIVTRAAAGGADCIQIREKDMSDAAMLRWARGLTDRAHELGLSAIINDRAHIASLVGADGVHLGVDDLPIAQARELLGRRAWIGRTCPTIGDAIEAIGQGADLCGLGPVFASTTKSRPELAGPDLIRAYLGDDRTKHTPMLAISGIEPGNAALLASIGCPGVAVSGAVCSSPDPEGVCRAIVNSLSTRPEAHEATI